MNDTETKSLVSTLSARINREHQACLQAAGKAIDHAMRCGDLLTEAKAGCRHGGWQGWLEENFEGSARTARGYMQIAANREQIENGKRLFDPAKKVPA